MTVNINNTTNKIVKKIKISGEKGAGGAHPGTHGMHGTASPLEMGTARPCLCRVTNAAPSCLSSVDQITDVVLYSLDKYTKTVCTEEIK